MQDVTMSQDVFDSMGDKLIDHPVIIRIMHKGPGVVYGNSPEGHRAAEVLGGEKYPADWNRKEVTHGDD